MAVTYNQKELGVCTHGRRRTCTPYIRGGVVGLVTYSPHLLCCIQGLFQPTNKKFFLGKKASVSYYFLKGNVELFEGSWKKKKSKLGEMRNGSMEDYTWEGAYCTHGIGGWGLPV